MSVFLDYIYFLFRENTQSIELISRIEADEVTYKEELLEEQEDMKRQLVESLALQRSNSLSSRFKKQRSKDQLKTAVMKQTLINVRAGSFDGGKKADLVNNPSIEGKEELPNNDYVHPPAESEEKLNGSPLKDKNNSQVF